MTGQPAQDPDYGTMSLVLDIARVCHEANRAWQQIIGDPVVSPPWDDAPEWQRTSAIDGVEAALAGTTPEQSHESWCTHRQADGWVYGPTKDAQARTHPCLVPYHQLPPAQQAKDTLFVAIVTALAGSLPVADRPPGGGG